MFCRICGYRFDEPLWLDDQIGPCCCVEAGVHDEGASVAPAYRAPWLAPGASWSVPGVEHNALTTQERFSHVSAEFA